MTNAQKYGAKAILIYSDPHEYAPVRDEDLYPHGWWLPQTGVQHGSILIGTGDPLTPRYPAKGKIIIGFHLVHGCSFEHKETLF